MTIVVGVPDAPSFSDFNGLRAAVIDFLDARGQERVDEFIGYAEDYIRSALDAVEREEVLTFTSHPFDVTGVRRIAALAVDGGGSLRQVTLADALDNYAGAGSPRAFSLFGQTVTLHPSPSENVTCRVYCVRELERLSVENQSNWLLDKNPSLYLYAALVHGDAYLRDPSWLDTFWQYVNATIANLNREAQDRRWSGNLQPNLGCVP